MSSPFIFDIASVADSHNGTETLVNEGPSPQRIGLEMIAIPEGAPVRTEAQVTPLGEGVMVHATVEAQLTGQCVRCLNDLEMEKTFTIDQVFSSSPDFITSDSEDADTDEEDDADAGVGTIVDNTIDLTQAVIDEVGLTLPFNPTCPDGCDNDGTDVPEPDGVSGEDEDKLLDPRWAGLEKFL